MKSYAKQFWLVVFFGPLGLYYIRQPMQHLFAVVFLSLIVLSSLEPYLLFYVMFAWVFSIMVGAKTVQNYNELYAKEQYRVADAKKAEKDAGYLNDLLKQASEK